MTLKQLYSLLNRKSFKGVACKAGCAFCCHIPVVCTEEEAALCLELAEPATVKAGDFAPCPFLDRKSRTCRVYPYRPLACRGYTSTSRLKCERAHRKRIKNADIPVDGQIYFYYQRLIAERGGEKRKLTEWLDARTVCQDR